MDIDGCGTDGLMSHKCFDGKQVRAIFIKVGAKGVTERMAGEPFFPSEPALMFMYVPGKEKRIDRSGRVRLLGEKPLFWAAICKPVFREEVKCCVGKDCIAVFPGFGMADMDTHIPAAYILITEMAEFTYTQPGRIHESGHGTLFQIRHGGDKLPGLLLGRDIGKIGVKLAHRELGWIPWFMKNIHGEKAQLGNAGVDGTVRKIPAVLDVTDKTAQFCPGNLLRGSVQDIREI